jgi:hypothetical protein
MTSGREVKKEELLSPVGTEKKLLRLFIFYMGLGELSSGREKNTPKNTPTPLRCIEVY